jgi:hypothetical protein
MGLRWMRSVSEIFSGLLALSEYEIQQAYGKA